MIHQEKDLWKLLKKGDACVVNNGGVIETGVIAYIARMTSGRVYIKVVDKKGEDLCLTDAENVIPANSEQIKKHLTSFELLLKKVEPTGMTTASGIYVYN